MRRRSLLRLREYVAASCGLPALAQHDECDCGDAHDSGAPGIRRGADLHRFEFLVASSSARQAHHVEHPGVLGLRCDRSPARRQTSDLAVQHRGTNATRRRVAAGVSLMGRRPGPGAAVHGDDPAPKQSTHARGSAFARKGLHRSPTLAHSHESRLLPWRRLLPDGA